MAIPCNGIEKHFFCRTCVKKQAETQIGQMRYEVKCVDISGCQAAFDRTLLQQVLGERLMKRLDFLQQMDEIAKSGMEGIEDCPFCEFKAICLPLELDKEFSCQNPDCGKVSCRLCHEEAHTPRTCEETRRERGIPERREVEEAMTKALVRTCPKCGVSIVKSDGCNKIRCRCGTLICDVCKADITSTAYSHFSPVGCPSFEVDQGRFRLVNEVVRAEREAIDRIVSHNDSISRDELHVEVPDPQLASRMQVMLPLGIQFPLHAPPPHYNNMFGAQPTNQYAPPHHNMFGTQPGNQHAPPFLQHNNVFMAQPTNQYAPPYHNMFGTQPINQHALPFLQHNNMFRAQPLNQHVPPHHNMFGAQPVNQ